MAKNIIRSNELDLLAGETHTIPSNTWKANPIQVVNSTFTFESVITKANQPIGPGATVYLYHKGLGTLIAKTETDPESKIYIPNLSKHNQYMVVAIDPKDIYNSVIFDITFDFNSKLFNNTTLKYYNIYDVPNIEKLYPYWNTLLDQRTDPSVLFFISNPNFKDDVEHIWGMTNIVKTTTIKDIRTFTFTNSNENIYLNFNPVPPKSEFTFSAYIYIDSNNRNITTNNNIFRHYTQSLFVDSNLKLNFKNTDASNLINLISNTSVVLDQWNHVSVSFDKTIVYLFLNGILQASTPNTTGMSYEDSAFYLGDTFKGYITQPLMNSVCKYTENFDFLLKAFSYKANVYSDPTDTLAEYVRIKINSNRLKYGLRDEVTNVAFSSGAENKYFTPLTTRTRMVATNKNTNPVLSNKDFCMEIKFKLKSTITTSYPRLIYNNYEQWTTNCWELDLNRPDSPNRYTLHVYNIGSWTLTHPVVFNELIDLALIRTGSELKFYINGFLNQTINIGTGSFDNSATSFLAFAWQMACHFYDFRLTVGKNRYSANYQPKQLEWLDPVLAFNQYQIINFSFKQYSSDSQNVLSFTNSNIVLKTDVSINNTKSAYFNTSKITSNNNLYIINEKFSIEMFYQPDITTITGVASILSISGAFRLGVNEGKLSFFNGTAWEDSTYTFDDTKLNHIVLQRNGTEIKLLAEGELVLTTTYTMPDGVKSIVIGCFNNTEYIKGYINNFIMYKNINRYEDIYTVPLEDPVVAPPEDAVPEVIVSPFTTAALDFEDNMTDRIPTTVWTKTGSTSGITSENKIFKSQSFEMKTFGDSITLPANHINSNSPYTIDFYMLYTGYTRGSSRTDTNISIFSKNTGGDKYVALTDNRILQWTLPHVKNESKIPPNEITHYTYTYDGAATRLFINNKLEAIGGGTMDFINGQPLSFGHHEVYGYPTWAFGTKGIWDNFNIHQGIATVVREKDPNEEFLVCDLSFDGPDNGVTFIDNAPSKPTWSLDGNSPTSYIRLTANSTTPKYKTGYSYYNKNYYNNSCIKSTNVDLNFGTDDWTLSFEFIKNDDAIYCNFISCAATNYTTDAEKLFYFCVMGSGYTGIPSLRKKLAFFNEKNLGQESVKNSVISNPYTTPNVLVSRTTIESGVAYKVDVVFKEGIMYLYLNNTLDTSIQFNIPINLSPTGLGTTIGGVPFSNEAGINGSINYVKAYKGVAIVPNSTTGLVNLKFDNNVTDSNGLSTWTPTSVSYSNVYSYQSYCAVFGTSSKITTNSQLLNFEDKNFELGYDINVTNTATGNRYAVTNNINYTNSGAIWLAASHYLGWDYVDKPANSGPLNLNNIASNTYYKTKFFRIQKTFHGKFNDVLVGTQILTNQKFNFAINNEATIGASTNFGVGTSFQGYIDNFKSHKEPTLSALIENNSIDTPAIFLPLETHPNNIGYNYNIVVNTNGSPLFTTIENVKCIKTEPNKYLSINSSNNLNLGDSSDFYLEIDFYKTSNVYGVLLSDYAGWTDGTTFLAAENDRVTLDVRIPVNSTANSVVSSNTFSFNTWNKLKVFRKGTTLSIDLNGVLTVKENYTSNIQFARSGNATCIGTYAGDTNNTFNGYISNFKLFIGRSTRPEKYNEKTVLDLDFSPTNKSYLFKDNFNKCIIHPFNITQRDYKNSEYCLPLNGTTQYLSLGKNHLLNFGNDEFVIHLRFSVTSFNNVHQRLIADNEYNGAFNYMMVTGTSYSLTQYQKCIFFGIEDSSTSYMFSTTKLELNSIYDVKITRVGNVFNMYVNDVLESSFTSSKVCNFNLSDNTLIGSGSPLNPNSTTISNQRFNGTFYSIKILRNTSDVSLLKNK